MFKKKKDYVTPNRNGATTLIAAGTEVHGDIKFSGNLEVEGVVRGNIIASGDGTDSSMRIMESGSIDGDVYVPQVVINGKVVGEVHSSKYIELAEQAVVEGNVHYNIIEMVRGSQVNGNLIYNAAFVDGQSKSLDADAGKDELRFGSAAIEAGIDSPASK